MVTRRLNDHNLIKKILIRSDAFSSYKRITSKEDWYGEGFAKLFGFNNYDNLVDTHNTDKTDAFNLRLEEFSKALKGPYAMIILKAMEAKHSNLKNRKRKRKHA